ncbi:hypothetical protein V6N13_050621 [Hibiscus sabdariffa]
MHDLPQEMAWNIVPQESKEPEELSRLLIYLVGRISPAFSIFRNTATEVSSSSSINYFQVFIQSSLRNCTMLKHLSSLHSHGAISCCT